MKNIMTIIGEHFPDFKETTIKRISIKEEVRKMCELNACGQYDKNWTCPPAVDSLDKIRLEISRFNNMVILYKIYHIDSSFDWKGMVSGIVDFRDKLINMKNDFPKDFKHMILGAGSCLLCERCAYIDGEKCRKPEDAFLSVEACGIDVVRLMKDNGLKYHNGANTVTYIGAVIYG